MLHENNVLLSKSLSLTNHNNSNQRNPKWFAEFYSSTSLLVMGYYTILYTSICSFFLLWYVSLSLWNSFLKLLYRNPMKLLSFNVMYHVGRVISYIQSKVQNAR